MGTTFPGGINCEALRFATSLRTVGFEHPAGRPRLRSFTLRNFIEDGISGCPPAVVSNCEALRFATSLRTDGRVPRVRGREIAKLYASQLH